MRRIYISGPVSKNPAYMNDFKLSELKLYSMIARKEIEYDSVINPASVCIQLPCDLTHEDYMRICFSMMELCDGIYMMDNWQDSIGAKMELVYASNRSMEILYEKNPD